jgi:hypothetical protein
MTVQTIPPIDEMTPNQRAELMEALWKEMSKNVIEVEPPERHRKILEERQKALANGKPSTLTGKPLNPRSDAVRLTETDEDQHLGRSAGGSDRRVLVLQNQKEELGGYFISSLMADIDRLELLAGGHPIYFDRHRMVASVFPYSIFYLVENDEVNVQAVIDNRRDPEWISERLH